MNKSWQLKVLFSFIFTDATDKELQPQLDRVHKSYLLNAAGV